MVADELADAVAHAARQVAGLLVEMQLRGGLARQLCRRRGVSPITIVPIGRRSLQMRLMTGWSGTAQESVNTMLGSSRWLAVTSIISSVPGE